MSDSKVDQILSEVEREEANANTEGDYVTLSTGAVLKIKKAPIFLAKKIEEKFKKPDVPRVYDENKDRYIENPMDPRYEEECLAVEDQKNMAMVDLMIGLGTELYFLPDTAPAFEDPEWREYVEYYLGEELPVSKKALYLYWVKYALITDVNDIQVLARKIGSKMGVTQEAVGTALDELKS